MGEKETECKDLVNQLCLDFLIRGPATTALRRKFKEIYAELNGGKEWSDGPDSGQALCKSKWGIGAYANASSKQQEMMEEGNTQNWDLNCLQSVITQMLTTALKDVKEGNNNNSTRNKAQSLQPVNWDQSWWGQMSKIRQLANIRHSIAHMPNETLTQGEFDEKWREAVEALKALGVKAKEINEIRQISQCALSLPGPAQKGPGQGQMSNQKSKGQTNASGKKKIKEITREERKTIEELRAKVEELQLQNQVKGQEEIAVKGQEEIAVKGQEEIAVKGQEEIAVKGQLNCENKNIKPVVPNMKNELKVNSLVRKGDSAGRSRDWNKALEFYTRALDIPDISDNLRRKIYMNRSWAHLKVLQTPQFPFNSQCSEPKTESDGKLQSQSTSRRKLKVESEKNLDIDSEKRPEKLTEEMKEFHLTVGITDAESAFELSPGQKSPKVFYRLAQFHQLKGDWKTALTYFDQALDNSDLDDSQLELDRNACQLELLNQTEVEEFHWIPGKKNQTMAGTAIQRNPHKWWEVMDSAKSDPQQKLYAQVVKAHFLAQGLFLVDEDESEQNDPSEFEVTQRSFDQVVKLYEGAAKVGLPSGLYNFGLLLQEGNGVSKDFYSAARCFEMAGKITIDDETPGHLKEGVLEARYRLGLCFEFGLGVGRDEKKALHWYEMASTGGYARASRKLGDIYSQGLLGVAKNEDTARFCSEQAAFQGDMIARTSASFHMLQFSPATPSTIWPSIFLFSKTIALNSMDASPTMLAAMLDQKRHFESTLVTVLQQLEPAGSQTQPKSLTLENEDREPEGASWNFPVFTNHTLYIIYLLELAQTPEFQEKLEATPNWDSPSCFTGRLVCASNSCFEGLAAVQELNRLYRETFSKAKSHRCKCDIESGYPPDLGMIVGVDPATLARENQLITDILDSFATSVRWVGTAFFRDRPTQELVYGLVEKIAANRQETDNHFNAGLLISYFFALKGVDWEQRLKFSGKREPDELTEPFFAFAESVVQGSLGKFEMAAGNMEKTLKQWAEPDFPDLRTKFDFLFVQAVCCKSAGLTRGVNSANRKLVKEAMGIFQKFLLTCSKDEPRRAEAHYQLGLCTLYLEKMKVKGQVKSSIAKDILTKVLPHFTQGEAAEQDLPWKELRCPDISPVKLILQRKIMYLECLVEKNGAQNLPSNLEGDSEKLKRSSFGGHVDPSFKFPSSSFQLKLRESRRIQVITEYRKFFKAAHREGTNFKRSSLPTHQLDHWLSSLPGCSYNKGDLIFGTMFAGCYEIVEPVFHCPTIRLSEEGLEIDSILAFTVIQDDSGAVFNLQFSAKGKDDEFYVGKIGAFQMGARIIIIRPFLRLQQDGETSLMVENAEAQIFHLPSKLGAMSKCGFCGEIGSKLLQCGKCQTAYYCDKECQTTDWTELKHKWICPVLQQQQLPLVNPGGKTFN